MARNWRLEEARLNLEAATEKLQHAERTLERSRAAREGGGEGEWKAVSDQELDDLAQAVLQAKISEGLCRLRVEELEAG